ncbi:hypothetical protein SS50377_20441 [Spironucleus salmonicida]|uniref:Uncharacterized protein n=1 Tax=Spironucleus salmonicida TaxID=348837 RepID=A0A9P8M022_9EUKA|nr:hypothetical protein SS50377_20441 [Spironucleus salmonicida]
MRPCQKQLKKKQLSVTIPQIQLKYHNKTDIDLLHEKQPDTSKFFCLNHKLWNFNKLDTQDLAELIDIEDTDKMINNSYTLKCSVDLLFQTNNQCMNILNGLLEDSDCQANNIE